MRASPAVETESAPLDDEARRALESLGYITGTDIRSDLPDPKRMLGVVQMKQLDNGPVETAKAES